MAKNKGLMEKKGLMENAGLAENAELDKKRLSVEKGQSLADPGGEEDKR